MMSLPYDLFPYFFIVAILVYAHALICVGLLKLSDHSRFQLAEKSKLLLKDPGLPAEHKILVLFMLDNALSKSMMRKALYFLPLYALRQMILWFRGEAKIVHLPEIKNNDTQDHLSIVKHSFFFSISSISPISTLLVIICMSIISYMNISIETAVGYFAERETTPDWRRLARAGKVST